MFETLIIDDERLARSELRRLLSPYSEIRIIGEASNSNEGIEQIEKLSPDLIFLDIQMPGDSGFDLLEKLDRTPKVIFVTAYDEYAIRAFEVNALDYLMKPVEPRRLDEAIKKLEAVPTEIRVTKSEGLLNENDQVFVKDGEKYWFIKLSEIRLFESAGNYAKVFFGTNQPLILKSLNSLEERLDPKTFFRANRKHIINLKMIEKIDPYFNGGLIVQLKGGNEIEISRRQAVKFKEMLSL